MCIVWYPLEFSRLHTIYTPGIGSLSDTVSSPLGRIQHLCTFAAAIANHYYLAFLFHQVPITAGWTAASWYERLAQHLYRHTSKYWQDSVLINFSDLTGTGYHSAMCYRGHYTRMWTHKTYETGKGRTRRKEIKNKNQLCRFNWTRLPWWLKK